MNKLVRCCMMVLAAITIVACSDDEPVPSDVIDDDVIQKIVNGEFNAVIYVTSTLSYEREDPEAPWEEVVGPEYGGVIPMTGVPYISGGYSWHKMSRWTYYLGGTCPLSLPFSWYLQDQNIEDLTVYICTPVTYDATTRSATIEGQKIMSLSSDSIKVDYRSTGLRSSKTIYRRVITTLAVKPLEQPIDPNEGDMHVFYSKLELYRWVMQLLRDTYGDEIVVPRGVIYLDDIDEQMRELYPEW
ncbi:MAG: hypothetical protein ACI30K_05375 [Muribaculaceae bacterium]